VKSVGPLLAEYRKRNHLSQLDLGMLADVSARHISFIETGKSNPSREMLLKLADTLNLSLHESNLLLNSGGFTPAFSHFELDAPEMEAVRDALLLMLEKQNPYPALVLDGDWNVLLSNAAQQALAQYLAIKPRANGAVNLLELVFDEHGYRPHIANWDEVAGHLLRRLRRQLLVYSRPGHARLFNKLLSMNPPSKWQQPHYQTSDKPVLTVDIHTDDQVLRMFSTLSQFGTALDVGTAEVLIENYFPADETSKAFFQQALKTTAL
jgi:transcriptional regulator with XRE-family HTH domain